MLSTSEDSLKYYAQKKQQNFKILSAAKDQVVLL